MNTHKEEFVQFMVDCGVLTFGEFTLKSGRISPYFVNTGKYRKGSQIARLGEFYGELFLYKYGTDVDVIYGPAYKGIPLVVSTATAIYQKHNIDIPYCYNRKEEKDHGEGGKLIGHQPVDGDCIVIIEDVVTSGKSLRESLTILKASANVVVPGVIVSVDRKEKGQGTRSTTQEMKDELGIDIHSIISSGDILYYLYSQKNQGKKEYKELITRMEEYIDKYGVY